MSEATGSGMDNFTNYQNGRYAVAVEFSSASPTTHERGANVTATTTEKNWAALAVLPIVFFVAMGNILVILGVKLDQKLRSSTNYFLTSLAVADLLVAITVMPPSLAMIINDYNWPFPAEMCGIWIMLDVCFSTSSILHLCMISLDRYLALAKPFQYSNGGWLSKSSSTGGWSTDKSGKSKWRGGTGHSGGTAKMTKRVVKRIVLVWATSLGIALPLPILGSQDRNKIFFGNTCVISIPEFTIYGSLVAFFLPLIIMFITYSLTIRTLQKQSKLVKCVMGKDGSSHRGRPSVTSSVASRYMPSRSSTGSTKTYLGKRVSSTMDGSSLPDILYATENGHKNANHQPGQRDSTASGISFKAAYTEGRIKTCALLCCVCVRSKKRTLEQEKDLPSGIVQSDYDDKGKTTGNKSESDTSETSSLNQPMVSRSPMLTRANLKLAKVVSKLPLNRVSTRRISASVKSRAIATEQRASKVLGMIFILFCIFWCPFFITNAFHGLCVCYLQCSEELKGLMENLMNWFVWIGYVSSGVNPCVYTLFSKQFRDTFRKLICCRCSQVGQGRFYRSYPQDGTTGGFSTSSFRRDFQRSTESREGYRGDSLGRSSLVVRQAPLRTFGESVVVHQHRRYQLARSADSVGLMNTEDDKRTVAVSETSPNDRLQWRSSWHCILDVDERRAPSRNTGSSSVEISRRCSKAKFRGSHWADHRKTRLFSDPDASHRAVLVMQDSIPEGDSDECDTFEMKSRTRERTHFGRREDNHPEGLGSLREERQANFRCGSSDEEDKDNNNIDEMYLNNREDKNFSLLAAIDGTSASQETRVRFSTQLKCKTCGASMTHSRGDSESKCAEQDDNLEDVEQDDNLEDVFKQTHKHLRSTNSLTENNEKDDRPKRYQLSRFDSGVGESVRNSDSF